MFNQINAIVRASGPVTLKVFPGNDGTLKVCFTPSGDPSKEKALLQPLLLVATPQELNEGFADALNSYQTSRTSLEEQVKATTTLMEAAKQKQSKKGISSLKSPPDSGSDNNEDQDADDENENSNSPTAASPQTSAPANSGTDLTDLI